MGETAENVAARLWRDRAQIREDERDEAQARARLAEGKLAGLTAENDQLARRNIQLRDQNDRLAVEIARLRACFGIRPVWASASPPPLASPGNTPISWLPPRPWPSAGCN